MKAIFLTALVIISFSLVLSDDRPENPPQWADQFEQDFTETFTYPIIGHATTNGKFFYDWTNKRYRVDRENGKWDRYCGTIYKFTDTPCTQYVVEGKRYMDYSEKNYCCYCCDAEHGCGILNKNWLSGATWEGYVNENGVEYEKWNKKGLQNNFYWATKDTRVMYKMDQTPNDLQTFDVKSYYEGIRNNGIFDLPSRCNASNTCPFLSVCTALRSGLKKMLEKPKH